MPSAIRLIQADDLDAWQRVLLLLVPAGRRKRGDEDGGGEERTDAEAGDAIDPPIVVVPSRAAAEQWRRTLEQRLLAEQWTPPLALQDALDHHVAPGAHGASPCRDCSHETSCTTRGTAPRASMRRVCRR